MPGGGNKKGGNNNNKNTGGNNEMPNFNFMPNPQEAMSMTNKSNIDEFVQGGDKKPFNLSELKEALGSEQVQGMFMDAIEKRLQNIVGKSSGFFTALPRSVQNRVLALHKIHSDKVALDKEYEKEVKELEKKYAVLFEPIYSKRTNIISGKTEADPSDVEEGRKKRKEMLGNIVEDDKEEEEQEDKEEKEEDKNIVGIPEFWLTCLKHCDSIVDMIEEKDEEALRYLENIKWKPLEESKDSFVIQFFFAKNPFFNNAVLEKTYHLIEDPEFGEVMYDRCEATPIDWKPNKNLTMKKVTKKQKPKKNKRGGHGKGARDNVGKTITVEEKVPSFFHFFSDPETMIDMYLSMVGENDRDAPDPEVILETDYEVGLELKEKLVPNAVIYYTGMSGLKDEDEEYEEDEEDEEGSYNSEEDEDYNPDERINQAVRGRLPPSRGPQRGGMPNMSNMPKMPNMGGNQPDCNQQ